MGASQSQHHSPNDQNKGTQNNRAQIHGLSQATTAGVAGPSKKEIMIRELDRKRINEWFDHLATAFQNVPRAYFVNHFEHDPYNDRKSIKVALDNGKIVSTVCVFARWMYLHPKSEGQNDRPLVVPFGGLGEVSTQELYRKQGLTKRLIQEAVLDMKDRGMKMCLLFSSPEMSSVYKSFGWKPKRREFIVERIQNFPIKDKDIQRTMQPTIRKPVFENNKEVEQLIALYRQYAKKFNGMVVRDHQYYWQHWIASHSEDPHNHSVTLVMCSPDNSDMIEAYLTVGLSKKAGDQVFLLVKDFFVSDLVYNQDKGRSALQQMIRAAMIELRAPSIGCKWPTEVDANTRDRIHRHRQELALHVRAVMYPSPLFPRSVLPSQGCDLMTEESLFYRMIENGDISGSAAHANVAECMKAEDFVFWDVDSF